MPADATTASTRDDVGAGLDALQTDVATRRPWPARLLSAAWPPLLAVVIVLAAWQALWASAIQPEYILPSPLSVLSSLRTLASDGDLLRAVGTSLERGVVGFAVAVVVGTPLGLLIARVRVLRVSIGPLITGLQVLPSVAWVPAAILWFGLTDATVYFVVLMGAVPSVVNGLVAGVDQVPPLYRRVGTVLGANRWEQVRYVVLPAALPGYLAGLKQGWAFSWRSLMAAEIIAVGGSIGFGLGSLLDQGRELQDVGVMISAIVLILAVGILVELAGFAPLERRVLRGRGLGGDQHR
jgi:NitT/TauT family transport system permease protein